MSFDFDFVAYGGFPAFGTFIENLDDGTVTMFGVVANKVHSEFAFFVEIKLSGRVDPRNADYWNMMMHQAMFRQPGKNFEREASNSWTYYTTLRGKMHGLGPLSGYTLLIHEKMGAQMGLAANGKNILFGASSWMVRETFFQGFPVNSVSDPAGQPPCRLRAVTPYSDVDPDVWDFNIDLDFCADAALSDDNFIYQVADAESTVNCGSSYNAGTFALELPDWDDACLASGTVGKNNFVIDVAESNVYHERFQSLAADTLLVLKNQADPTYKFLLLVAARTNDTVSPVLACAGSTLQAVYSQDWYLMSKYVGVLSGLGPLRGYNYLLEPTQRNFVTGAEMSPFQIGLEANNRNLNVGFFSQLKRTPNFEGTLVTSATTPLGQPASCKIRAGAGRAQLSADINL